MVTHLVRIILELSACGLETVFKRDINIFMGMISTVTLYHDFLARHIDPEMYGETVTVVMGCLGSRRMTSSLLRANHSSTSDGSGI